MKSRTILSALALFGAAFASADHNWRLDSTYDFFGTTDFGGASFHDVDLVMGGGSVDDSYGWAVSTGFRDVDDTNPFTLSLNTYPFFGRSAAKPILEGSLILGVLDALPSDTPGQQHLVLFTSPTVADRIENLAFGTIFDTSNQSVRYTEETLIDALIVAHGDGSEADKQESYDIINAFRFDVARNANVGPNGTRGDAWFSPSEGFSVVIFSDARKIGTGTNPFTTTFTPVPEPASFAVLGVGALALLRRRRR